MNKNIATYLISNIGDLVSVIANGMKNFDGRLFWWRGQADSVWKIQPSLYHKKFSQKETDMAVRFLNQAKVRHNDVPAISDGPSWVFLMQHYGLPTRLLDWPRSPMTALYFAVKESEFHDRDGVVWGVQPALLNKVENSKECIFGISNPVIQPVFSGVWENPVSEAIKKNVLAITSQYVDVRQMVQASEFTIHGTEEAVDELPEAHEYLIKIVIPKEVKKEILQVLKWFHISESYLFPDLEHLANDLVNSEFYRA